MATIYNHRNLFNPVTSATKKMILQNQSNGMSLQKMLKQTPREFYYTFNNGPSHLSLCHVTFDSKFSRKKLLQKKLLPHSQTKKILFMYE